MLNINLFTKKLAYSKYSVIVMYNTITSEIDLMTQ